MHLRAAGSRSYPWCARGWLSHSCRIVHAEARARECIEPDDRCSCEARGSTNRAQPRASSASLGCIPRASTRETALERSAECNAQCRANTRRRDVNSCARTLFTATIMRIFVHFASSPFSFSRFSSLFFFNFGNKRLDGKLLSITCTV